MKETRLIDAHELIGEMQELIRLGYTVEDMVDAVIEAPTIVVKCKDCKYMSEPIPNAYGKPYCLCLNDMGGIIQLYDYCSKGERKP